MHDNNQSLDSIPIHHTVADHVVEAIRRVVGIEPAALHEPSFRGNEWTYLKDCLDSTFVSSVGAYVDRFESELAAYTGARYAVAVVNGTAALHLSLKLAGVRAGDEVLIPTLTFVATANATTYCGATPHFVDVEQSTLGVDTRRVREYLSAISEMSNGCCVNKATGRVIRALVVMHTFGHPSDLEGALAIASDFNLALVEDAAESLGSYYHGRHTGTLGLMGTLSFNGNKTITTGGGGAILTNDAELAREAKYLSTTAKQPHRWAFIHDDAGYNYRLPNLNAALGCAQLEQLPGFLVTKRKLFAAYIDSFEQVRGVRIIKEPTGCQSNYWLQAIMLDEGYADARDMVLSATNDTGLMTRPVWRLMHKLKPYCDCPRMETPIADSIERTVINIPSSVKLLCAR